MHIVKSNFFDKSRVTGITSAMRSASCDRGWLRIVVECLFGMVTVASFILIVLLALRSNRYDNDRERCKLYGCRIVCVDVPHFGRFEDDIIFAVSAAGSECNRKFLTLNHPMFINSTLPPNWLSRMRSSIFELSIIGGNLQYIAPGAFMNSFTADLRCLVLENITISSWEASMLVGLSRLRSLYVKNSNIHNINGNAMDAVDTNIKSLTITGSGSWNPANLTGTTNLISLEIVDFSFNNFSNLLNNNSFVKLDYCKILYLNSCKITDISLGTFDSLTEIQILYLNDNHLVTIPYELFIVVGENLPRPRIYLEGNYWLCECSINELRRLSARGMLVVDPVCYYPEDIRGTFLSGLEDYCSDDEPVTKTVARKRFSSAFDFEYVYMNRTCHSSETTPDNFMRLISPLSPLKCSSNRILPFNTTLSTSKSYRINGAVTKSDFVNPTFALKSGDFSMLEISSEDPGVFGLIWYQSECPSEIYCISTLPKFLRVFNIDEYALYTFCPILVSTGTVESDRCVSCTILHVNQNPAAYRLTLIICIGLACLVFGAMCVYALIRKYPYLLKGSERILFVKHKSVDALILPPKVPLRSSFLNDKPVTDFNDKGIFVMPNNNQYLSINNFMRSSSVRSEKSTTPSYVSALEPTDAQLEEWRLRHHFDNMSSAASLNLDVSAYSWINNDENSLYLSLSQDSNTIYESLK